METWFAVECFNETKSYPEYLEFISIVTYC